MNDMTKPQKSIIIFLIALLVFSACKNDLNNKTINLDENLTYIKIGCENARTIQPDYNLSSMRDFVLSGKKAGTVNEIIITEADSYLELISQEIAINVGDWTFTLKAKEEDTAFSCTINKRLERGVINTLNFVLSVDTKNTSTEYGTINIIFEMLTDSYIQGIRAGLYDIESEELVNDSYIEVLQLNTISSKILATYNKESVPIGKYWFKADFYSDTECTDYLNTYETVIYVVAGNTSNSIIDVEDLARPHRITYVLNGGDFVDGYEPPISFSGIIHAQLPKATDVRRAGYGFAGWYLASGERVLSVDNYKTDIVLYANWRSGIIITPEDVDFVDLTTEFGELVIIPIGDFSNKFMSLCNVIKNYSDSIVLDMSNVYGVRKIPDGAFKNCESLISIILPDSVSVIGDYAFFGCPALESITIPSSVNNIGGYSFGHEDEGDVGHDYSYEKFDVSCYNVKVINFTGSLFEWYDKQWFPGLVSSSYDLYIGDTKITDVVIPNYYTSLGDGLFFGCASLKSVEIPEGVTSIGLGAFYDCPALSSITIPSSLTDIGDNAFGVGNRDIYGHITAESRPAYTSNIRAINYLGTIEQWIDKQWYTDSVSCIYKLYLNEQLVTDIVIPDNVTSINDSLFRGCFSLETIILSEGVTRIGSYAFDNCIELTSITIPTTVDYMGDSVFQFCKKLKNITIENGVKEIGSYAFNGCTSITNIEIPGSIECIGQNAFSGCTGLTDVTLEDGITEIGNAAFYGCTGLTKLNIPESVESIGAAAFSRCINIEEMEIPGITINSLLPENLKKVTILNRTVSSRAFYNCANISTIVIKDGVTGIDEYAFYGCTGITELEMPNSIKYIDNYAFSDCTELTDIVISDNVTRIGNYAFNNCIGLTDITIPNRVTKIGNYAFCGCTGFTDIEIPNSVSNIGNYAFYGCTGFTDIEIPNSVTNIGAYAFSDCKGLTNIEISDRLTNIGEYAFSGCDELKCIIIPSSVTNIENGVFNGCTQLKEVYIVDGNTTLTLGYNTEKPSGQGKGLFSDCPLKYVYLGRNLSYIGNKSTGYSPFYGETVSYIGNIEASHSWYMSLESVDIGETVTELNGNAFAECRALKKLTIKDSSNSIVLYTNSFTNCPLENIYLGRNFDSIGVNKSPFYEKTTLISIDVSDKVSSFPEAAFEGCTSLNKVNYAGTIDQWVGIDFNYRYSNPCWNAAELYINNEKLTDVKISNDVTSIKGFAFYGCSWLKDVTIPNSVTSLGNYVFKGCTSLANISLPDNITQIGEGCFNGCTGLANINLPDNLTQIGTGTFKGCTGIVVTISAGFMNKLKSGYVRSIFAECENYGIIISDNVTSIGNSVFYECIELVSVKIPNSVVSIGNKAFYGCEKLASIEISDSLTTIGINAFYDCRSLGSIEFSDKLTNIQDNAFKDCNNLYSVVFAKTNNWYSRESYSSSPSTDILENGLSSSTTAASRLRTGRYFYIKE